MPILLLGVPIFDTVLVIISRFRRHLHFYDSGTDHTYHRLVKMGFSDVQAVNLMLLAATALEILAFFIISRPPLTANLIFFAVVLAGIFLIYFLESENMWESIRLKKNGD
jgi:UDP-GlcNAc:undecaprenyl-phosphate GlcNAc-1-phosphate transferase